MKDLKVRQETIKILKEKAGKKIIDLGHSNFLLNMSPEARETKAKIYQDKKFPRGKGNNQHN